MKLRDSQGFLALYYEPNVVETALGTTEPHADPDAWKRETKSLGQVPTPEPVARLMAQWVMSVKPATVLDPAAGLGNLLHECHNLSGGVTLVGVERDQETFLLAKSAAPRGTKLVLADYLLSDTGPFQGIIANPPYVKAHRLDYSEDTWRAFEERFETPLDRLTNLYALFLLKIWQDLAAQGRAAVIVPAECLNANFGEEIKERLLKAIRPAGIVVFNPALNLFEDSLTTSAIFFLEKGRPRSAPCKLAKADSLAEAEAFLRCLMAQAFNGRGTKCRDLDTFRPADKWLNTLLNGKSSGTQGKFRKTIGDYFDCRRGIATGANDFFCLSRPDLDRHGLHLSQVDPCITKATDAEGLVFTSEKFTALANSERRCYLLNPSSVDPAIATYLRIGEGLGIPHRHLPSHRPVWYLPENRAAADIWVAVFSRETVKYILNTAGAKNLTCFHGLYAKPAHKYMAPLVTLYLNSAWGSAAFSQVNRFYGDGLNKLEPKDVEALPCPEFPSCQERHAQSLIKELITIESLSPEKRSARIDQLVAAHLDLS